MPLLRRNRSNDPERRIPRKDRRGASPFVVGAVFLAVIAALSYLGFTKHVPFTKGFQFEAVFQTSNSIRKNSPVRIAGVNVGKVKKVERYTGPDGGKTDYSVVTMEVQDAGLPIHKDATAKIRPRIFLEGNFFVDLQPGTPETPTIDDGDTLPVTQTAAPVQLGDVLTSLQADDRKNLQDLLRGFGGALTLKPSARDDRTFPSMVKGKTAAESLNLASRSATGALRGVSIVNDAFLGTEPHDLSKLVKGLDRTLAGLGRSESTLQDFVTNFNATMAIFASESSNLQATIRELAPTLAIANRTFGDLNAAFPSVRAFAREFLPAVRETPATIQASFPWIKQVRALVSPAELQGLAKDLSPATRDLAAAINGTVALLPQQNLLAQCLTKVVLPTGDIKIQDGPLSNDVENYKEFWYTMTGLAGESQNFDGNGKYVRFQPGGGTQTTSTGASSLSGDQLFGRTPEKPIGTRPRYPGKRPPYKPDVPCFTQKIPDVNGAANGPPDSSRPGNPPNPLPQNVTIPATPATGSVTIPIPPPPVSARTKSADTGGTVAGELLDRLNPFRGAQK
jgi:ABC-type transporter Mla subunit MlaD